MCITADLPAPSFPGRFCSKMLSSMLHFSPTVFHKIAGVSGVLAIALGAYGSHGNYTHFHFTYSTSKLC